MLKLLSPDEGFDLYRLKAFLLDEELIADIHSECQVQQYSNGYSNLTFLVTVENKEFVLRKPPKGAVKRGHDMSREYKVLSHLHKGFDKAPKTYSYCDDLEVMGTSFYLMEKMEGIILSNKETKKRSPNAEEFGKIYQSWLNVFKDLHDIDYKSIGLGDLGKPKTYVERQVTNWSKQYLKAATMDLKDAQRVIDWLKVNQPNAYEHSFIHNDYKYDNVVFKDDTWNEISAVLDWEMCTIGDPLMDLGTSLAYWMRPSDGPGSMIIPSPTLMDGNPSRNQIVEDYGKRTGRSMDHILFYYVFGLFKIAVIVQQIFYRYHLGLTQNPKFAQLDQACALFCQMANQAIEKKRIENFM